MNTPQDSTTTAPQAILIRHWHNYFENGQTRRIKNLTYNLMPVDHDAFSRRELLRAPGGHTALVIFYELISLATRCPQRGLLVRASGAITPQDLAAATGMSESCVSDALHLLREQAWITYVACPKRLIVSGSLRTGRKGKPVQPEFVHLENPSEGSPDLHIEWEYHIVDKGNGPETERRLPEALKRLLDWEAPSTEVSVKDLEMAEKSVAWHRNKGSQGEENSVACHSEHVDIKHVCVNSPEIRLPKPKSNNRRPFYDGIYRKK